jgi:hypothetical protein
MLLGWWNRESGRGIQHSQGRNKYVYIQNIRRKTWWEETNWEIYMGYNIKMGLTEIRRLGVYWIHLAVGKVQWQALMNRLMKLLRVIYCGIVAQSKNCGITDGVFCAVRADYCACNNGISCHRVQQLHCNRGTVFSTRSVPICYEQDQFAVAVRELLGSVVEMFLLETGSRGRGPSGNSEEGERPPLEADTKQRLVKTVTD